jgi:hypothetical protein
MSKKKKYAPYNFYVDMSGVPYDDDLYIGAVFINELFSGRFIKEFYREFPELKSFKKKAVNLPDDKLKQIIDYFEKRKVRCVCIKFHKHKMRKYYTEILDRKNSLRRKKLPGLFSFKEKLLGILYYYLLKQDFVRKNWHYGFEACVESHMNILEVMKVMNNLSHRDSYLIHPRYNNRRIQHMLKFADFVAGAGRRFGIEVMKCYHFVKYFAPEIDVRDSDKVFGINKEAYQLGKEQLIVEQQEQQKHL